MKSASKTVPLSYIRVCHGLHNPFHNKMASADALASTRFIRACSRVKPTTETKNNASKVIRVTLKSPIEAQPAQGLIELDRSDKLGFGVGWVTPRSEERR